MAAIREFRIHQFGGPGALQCDKVEPSLPDASQVLVAVKAASINPVDFKIRDGKYPSRQGGRLRYTLERDVWASSKSRRPGDRVQSQQRGVWDGRGSAAADTPKKAVLDQKAIA